MVGPSGRGLLMVYGHFNKWFIMSAGRLRPMRRILSGECALRVGFLLRERLLSESRTERRAECPREVWRRVVTGSFVGEVLFPLRLGRMCLVRRVRDVGRLVFGRAVRLIDDGLVATLHENGDVTHVGRGLVARLRVAHRGCAGGRRG